MLKRHTNLLLLITTVFAAFTLGFYSGQHYQQPPVHITNIPQETVADTRSFFQAPATEASALPEETQNVTQPPETIPSSSTEEVVSIPESEPPETEASASLPPATQAPPQTTEPAASGLININTASAAELMTLPGIGEVLSQRIVEYRQANGPFPSVAALTNVSGIGEKRLAAIIHLITV